MLFVEKFYFNGFFLCGIHVILYDVSVYAEFVYLPKNEENQTERYAYTQFALFLKMMQNNIFIFCVRKFKLFNELSLVEFRSQIILLTTYHGSLKNGLFGLN